MGSPEGLEGIGKIIQKYAFSLFSSKPPPTDEPSNRKVFFATFFSHGFAQVGGRLIVMPFDRAKILRQVNSDRGVVDLCKQCWQQKGPLSFYRGIKTHMTSIALGLPLRLSFYRSAQLLVPAPASEVPGPHGISFRHRFGCYLLSSWATLSVVYPLDVQYTRLAADMNKKPRTPMLREFISANSSINKISLYRGFSLCLLTSIPFLTFSLAVHDALRSKFLSPYSPRERDFRNVQPGSVEQLTRESMHLYPYNILCGIGGGVVSQFATYPLDTVRRRYMVDERYSSWIDCLKDGMRQPRSLYAGCAINVIKFIPEAGALCLGYYFVQSYLDHLSLAQDLGARAFGMK